MNIVTETQSLLSKVISTISAKKNQPEQQTELIFMLSSSTSYSCKCGNEEVKLSTYSFKASLAAGKIREFIVNALVRFSKKENIELQNVNFVVSKTANGTLNLTLRNAFTSIRSISIEELTNN